MRRLARFTGAELGRFGSVKPGYGPDQAQRIAGIVSMPLQEAGAPRALLDRLESTDNETPTEDDFAAAVAALDALDKAGHRALRVEQSYR